MSHYFVRTVIVKITDVRTEPVDSLLNASAGGGEEGVLVRSCVGLAPESWKVPW